MDECMIKNAKCVFDIDSADMEEKIAVLNKELPKMLLNVKEPAKFFKRNLYENNFKVYMREYQDTLELFMHLFRQAKEKETFFEEIAESFVSKANGAVNVFTKKRRKEECLMNLNLTMVIYVNPAFIEYNQEAGEFFVPLLIEKWKENFPETNLKYASFEQINDGFKKRFCYITTAVCESLHKPDDCYELTLLRNYRDIYVLNQKTGEELIKQYYDMAPTIVKRINKCGDRKNIYQNLWDDYLSPCIRFIEEDENEKCLVLYTKMVHDLAKRFFRQEGRIA